MQSLKVRLVGTTPLLVSNPQTVNPHADISKAIAELTSKRKRSEAEDQDMHRLKFQAALYIDSDGPYLPSYNIFKSGQEAARLTKEGKLWERGISLIGERSHLSYKGPKDADGLWSDKRFVDVRDGRVSSGARILVTRPIFPEWSVEATFMVAEDVADPSKVLAHLVTAGQLIGVGTYRARFGRFSIEVVETSANLDKAIDNLGLARKAA
jgi:hypothetical protein